MGCEPTPLTAADYANVSDPSEEFARKRAAPKCWDLNCRGQCHLPSGYWDNGSAVPKLHIGDHS